MAIARVIHEEALGCKTVAFDEHALTRMHPKFRLEVSYDEATGDPVAAYVRVREGAVAQTKEIRPGVAFADYAANGALLGIELLEPCGVDILENVSKKEPEEVRRFLRRGLRKEMIQS